MSVYVIDSSVAAKWFQYEVHADAARRLIVRQDELHAPDFFQLEFHNILCKWLRRGLISTKQCERIRKAMRITSINFHPWDELFELAFSIANQTGRSLYDCLYLSLAVNLGYPFVTADRKLYDSIAVGSYAENIVWVEDLS